MQSIVHVNRLLPLPFLVESDAQYSTYVTVAVVVLVTFSSRCSLVACYENKLSSTVERCACVFSDVSYCVACSF
jgi:hypothetical protein